MSNEIRPVVRHRVFKLTDERLQTYGGFQWEIGKTYTTDGKGELCGASWLHCYADPRLAVLLNPIHVGFRSPRLFEAYADGVYRSDGLKAGVSSLRLDREMTLPTYSTNDRVAFAIFVARRYSNPSESWTVWADAWLDGQDQSVVAAAEAWAAEAWAAEAEAAARAAEAAAEAEAEAEAEAWAAEAARAAAEATPFSLIAVVNELDQWKTRNS